MEIYLIRHAQSKGNETSTVQGQTDTGLSEAGKEQAKELAKYFSHHDIHAIYSSDLTRTVETARPLAQKLQIEIIIDPNLREAHFGEWEGMTYESVKEKYPREHSAWHKDYCIRPPWFESFESHQKRTRQAIKTILNKHSSGNKIAIFTHGGNIKTQVGFFRKLTGEDLTQFTTNNCSLTLLKFNLSRTYEEGSLVYYNKQVIQQTAKATDSI